MESKILLAVTNEQRYLYHKVNKIVFTYGEWMEEGCEWAKEHQIDYEALPSKWNSRAKIYNAHNYVEKMAVNLSHEIADDLNCIHNIKFTAKAWEAELHLWLVYWISSLYDKYCDLRQAKEIGDFAMVCEENICIQNNLYELGVSMNDISYNVQQYTCLMHYFGYEMIDQQGKNIREIKYVQNALTLNEVMANKKFCNKLQNDLQSARVIVDADLRSVLFDNISKLTNGLIEYMNISRQFYCVSPIDLNLRKTLNRKLNTRDEFEKFIYENIGYFIPVVFLEGFHEIWFLVNTMKNLRAVISRAPFDENEIIRLLALKARENGGEVYQIQHGGMGIEQYIGAHCIKYNDVFYSWGWKGKTDFSPYKKMPSIKISKCRNLVRTKDADMILFVENLSKYHIFRFDDYYDSDKLEKIQEEDQFINGLENETFTKLVVRPYLRCEKERRQYLNKRHLGITVSGPGVSYHKALSKARLVVIPCMVTTWLEALAADIPVIILMKTEQIFYNNVGAYKDVQLMKKAGILQETPEEAAKFVNKNYYNIEAWWNSDLVRGVVSRLKGKYAYASRFLGIKWKMEIAKIFIEASR